MVFREVHNDWLEFAINSGGQIDLSGLQTVTDGHTRFAVDAPSFSLANLESAVGVSFDMRAEGSTLTMPKLLTQDGGEHQVPNAHRALGHAYGGGSQYFSMWVVGSEPL